jgi:hypothetical protein
VHWFRLYLLAVSISLVVADSGAALYATLTNTPLLTALGSAVLLTALVLIGIGVVSILPLSEYSYSTPHGRGRAGVNPAVLREGAAHMRRKREPRKLGMLLGIVGVTLLLVYFIIHG